MYALFVKLNYLKKLFLHLFIFSIISIDYLTQITKNTFNLPLLHLPTTAVKCTDEAYPKIPSTITRSPISKHG